MALVTGTEPEIFSSMYPGHQSEGPVTSLPVEILLHIFSFIEGPKELCDVMLVKKTWFFVAGDDKIWRPIAYRDLLCCHLIWLKLVTESWKVFFFKSHAYSKKKNYCF